jgi:hypothetical protein
MSSVTAVGNSILLGRYKPKFANIKPKSEEIYANEDLIKAYSLQPDTRLWLYNSKILEEDQ